MVCLFQRPVGPGKDSPPSEETGIRKTPSPLTSALKHFPLRHDARSYCSHLGTKRQNREADSTALATLSKETTSEIFSDALFCEEEKPFLLTLMGTCGLEVNTYFLNFDIFLYG